MRTSKQARREARELFRSCLVNGRMDPERVRQAVRLTLQGKPHGYMGMLWQFERLVRLEIARHTAQIESAVALPHSYQEQLKSDLSRLYGEGLDFVFSQNPERVGGVRVQVGGDVYDGTVQARLEALLRES